MRVIKICSGMLKSREKPNYLLAVFNYEKNEWQQAYMTRFETYEKCKARYNYLLKSAMNGFSPKQVEEALKFGYENTHKEIYGGIGQERFFNENIDLGLLIIDIRSVVK